MPTHAILRALLLFVACVSLPASAQGTDAGADLHGPWPVVSAGDARDPVFLWAGPRVGDPKLALSGYLELNRAPVSAMDEDGDSAPLVEGGWAAALSFRYTPSPRIAITGTLPALGAGYVTENLVKYGFDGTSGAGVGLGDVRITALVSILGPDEGLSVSAAPWVAVSPAPVAFLASGDPSGGLTAATGWRAERWAADVNLGLAVRPSVVAHGGIPLQGSLTGTYGAAFGRQLTRGLWLAGELRGSGNLAPDYGGAGLATLEGMIEVRGALGRSSLAIGGSRGLVSGPGAADGRLWGAGTLVPASAKEHPEGDEPTWVFRVVDPDGVPVAGARVTSDGEVVGVTDGAGEVTVLRSDLRWGAGVRVEGDRFLARPLARPSEGDALVAVPLEWRPAVLEAKVTGATGEAVPAEFVARNLDRPDAAPIRGRPGELLLPPGRYRVTISPGAGLGEQERVIVVPTNGAPPQPLDVVVLPSKGDAALALDIVDPEGAPITGARVLVDGLPVGVTSEGGSVALRGLAPGPHEIVVQHESFTGVVRTAEADFGGTPVRVPLQRQPGTVRVVARTVSGQPVPDAVVRFVGVARLPPMALGPASERIQVLSPGEWVAVVSSPTLGVQERQIVVPPDRYELIPVSVVFQPIEEGVADLDLRVVDPSGAPIEGADVRLDDASVGATSTGGGLVLRGLAVGPRSFAIAGPDLRPAEGRIELTSGVQERVETVRYVPGVVDVVVRGPDGPVTDALVRFGGGSSPPPAVRVPSTGRLRSVLAPGAWTVVVTSPTYGVQERDLALPPDDGVLHTVEVVLAPFESGEASLEVEVVDPRGRPVANAHLSVDGVAVGSTANTGVARFEALDAGARTVRIDPSGPYSGLQQPMKLVAGANRARLAVPWAPSVVEVAVKSGGQPVKDAVVRLIGDDVRTKPYLVDGAGEAVVPAGKGLWAAFVTSPIGLGEREFQVERPFTRVEVEVTPPGPERADLAVTVVDPDGRPVDDAIVYIDGAKLGDTEVSGVAIGRGLDPKRVQVSVRSPEHPEWGPLPVELTAGGTQRVKVQLDWLETDVEVVVRGPDGAPAEADVRWRGGRDVPEQRTGADGVATARLTPGTWRVYASAGSLAADQEIAVEAGSTPGAIEIVLAPTGATMAGESVRISEMVQFDFGQATLRPDSAPILAQVADLLLSQPDIVRVEVQGHTDTVGTVEVNMALSQARAEAVVAALVALGVPKETIFPRGYGPTSPVADNETDAGRAQNRRVQFEIRERAAAK